MITSLILALRTSRSAQILAAVAVLLAIGVGVYVWALAQNRSTVRTATEAGRTAQQRDDLQTTIDRTKEANNAAEAVRHDPAVRDAACLRYARNPDDC